MTTPDEQAMAGVRASAESNGGIETYVRQWLGDILDYDSRQGSDLVRTLSVYLECGGDHEETARALGIHRSTARYRMQRIREIGHHDLLDPDTCLHLQAATRALADLPGPRGHRR
ncbi:PucR family transcriptional regulator [Pseudonocardia sp. H11422]|uniref:PucR family transcriptional regulator n=1 Tax=Pseudonocardia sp. H11422 TaxID=2835866 RepID=UPI001BDC4A01|nr:helix-turn-helix domain-containing protein [Pseudonocardia sp. H11422]